MTDVDTATDSYRATVAAFLQYIEDNGHFPSMRDLKAVRAQALGDGGGSLETLQRHTEQLCRDLLARMTEPAPAGLPQEIVEPAQQLVRIIRDSERAAAQALAADALAQLEQEREARAQTEARAAAAEAAAGAAQTSVEQLARDAEAHRLQIGQLRSTVEALEQQLEHHRGEGRRLQADLQRAGLALERAHADAEHALANEQRSASKVRELEQELERFRIQRQETERALTVRLSEANEQNAALAVEGEALKQRIADLAEQVGQLRQTHRALPATSRAQRLRDRISQIG